MIEASSLRSEVRDPVAASARLTRWNSWTDGQSPDGKRTQARPLVPRTTTPAAPPESVDRTGEGDDLHESRAGRDAARADARRQPRRPARPQPAGRLRHHRRL